MAKKKLTKKATALLSVFIVLVVISSVVLGLCLYAVKVNDYTEPSAAFSCWMDYVQDEALLRKVAIPGSHDAATAGMFYMSKTQDRSIYDQLRCGTRYLDIRVAVKKGVLTIYHGPIYGMTYETVLKDVTEFLSEHPTETIVIDLQHFKDEAKTAAMTLTDQYLNGYYLKNDTYLPDISFIDQLTLGDARGKVIVFIGEDDGTYTSQSRFFARGNDEGTAQNVALHSYYNEKYNKGNAKKYVSEYVDAYLDQFKSVDSGLFVLQGQLTDGLVLLGPKFRESQNLDAGIDSYFIALGDRADLSYVNVVLRDFVNPQKNAISIKLNEKKNIIKPNKIDEFRTLFA